ncbi:SMP-30/gluconolactonase/LRE family protein (plasmid) [Rhizobium sp. CB3171]|uniref:SMP-30/gluconolactonase/LRE family protein n=1 Tax=unclassified Rhizobium TaxID=2613769 RepID=UPI000CDF5093|nr:MULTISPECIES: SMP-30/gluconolactonase/LRE family protein [Rhizobium]AVA26557.1 SMP-30/gluconolaconase/LRE domain-containing protein [Rhizobium sp. NXC24]MDK4742953.1 SMP-30/gluconolactonase/LRE family protein [Rhizobium sp. CNPSo 3464]UWU24180.1 SMP-30/gluconolactonase/LRE family protein [Rhizobium tropici]WFU05109.1 SMP-30/gluconolactonase/LRE family protein [Rhizobium sp. CB3171]
MEASCVVDCKNTLGEGCVWDPRDRSVYWTDIAESRIYKLGADGAVTVFPLPERAGFILPRKHSGFVLGLATRVVIGDAGFRNFETVSVIEEGLPQTRVNDAAVDPFGGVVFGTFDERDRKPAAALYRCAPTGEITKLLEGITISNGIAFSPSGDVMYFADTAEGTIRRFEIRSSGWTNLRELAPLANLDVADGRPDGAVVDSEGSYWSARVWGGCLARIGQDGQVQETVKLPTKGPTCVTLGGKDGRTLYATTLRVMHTDDELEAAPLAGGLFAVQVKVPGVPQRLAAL